MVPAGGASQGGPRRVGRRGGRAAGARAGGARAGGARATAATAAGGALLKVEGLEAEVEVAEGERKKILQGLDLEIRGGEIHAIMGKNGSGKSTLSKVLVGHPDYEVRGGSVSFKGDDLLEMEPEERCHAGLFLSFQSPVEVPGVSNTDFLRMAYNAKMAALGRPELEPLEFYAFIVPKLEQLNIPQTFLNRNVNEGFSGGEKKRNEILQLAVLDADLAILDEIDSGLDVDALRDVSAAVNGLARDDNAILMITHYKRLLEYVVPDHVHIMQKGEIIASGGMELADLLEKDGYAAFKK